MNDYKQMADVINYLNEHYREQPSLDDLAAISGLSRYYFQRKFTAWVGVSPKSFLQFLTLENAKVLLDHGHSIMDAAHGTGLSGTSRLHDLCVKLQAASPGEIKRGGEGLAINYGFGFCPFGECLIATSSRGIMQLGFINQDQQQAVNKLQVEWPQARLEHNDQAAREVIRQVFNRDYHGNKQPALHLYVKGTQFQLHVWRALLQIAPGRLVTYGQLAQQIGQPRASRAVGSAVGKNPLAYLIPCHRVIRATGAIGDYHWGSGRKQAMIAYGSTHTKLVN